MSVYKTRIAKIIATFGGLGNIPIGPGTFGALGGLAVAVVLNLLTGDGTVYNVLLFFLVILGYFTGVAAASHLEDEWGHDASKVVIDEAMGYWVSILFIPFSWSVWIVAFFVFRFFDIVKPFGIRSLDKINSPHGVMLDDLLAGVYTNISIFIGLNFL